MKNIMIKSSILFLCLMAYSSYILSVAVDHQCTAEHVRDEIDRWAQRHLDSLSQNELQLLAHNFYFLARQAQVAVGMQPYVVSLQKRFSILSQTMHANRDILPILALIEKGCQGLTPLYKEYCIFGDIVQRIDAYKALRGESYQKYIDAVEELRFVGAAIAGLRAEDIHNTVALIEFDLVAVTKQLINFFSASMNNLGAMETRAKANKEFDDIVRLYITREVSSQYMNTMQFISQVYAETTALHSLLLALSRDMFLMAYDCVYAKLDDAHKAAIPELNIDQSYYNDIASHASEKSEIPNTKESL